MNNLTKNFVGVDVSKRRLDIHVHPAKISFSVDNTQAGVKKLCQKLCEYQIEQIACEASGGYERLMVKNLNEKGFNIRCTEPYRVKAFIRSEGVFAKTDASDAKMIVLFASQKTPNYEVMHRSDEDYELAALIRRRDDLTTIKSSEKTRLEQEHSLWAKKNIANSIRYLEKQIKKIDVEVARLIRKNEKWKQKAELAQTVPGIGPRTAEVLVAALPELGNISDSSLSALVGVAPFTQQSGSRKGTSFIRGGRADVRKALYMAALTAAFSNSVLKEFYQRLIAAGKKPKLALIAVARKLLIILNAMFRNNQAWAVA